MSSAPTTKASKPTRPKAPTPKWGNIPGELRERDQWVVWAYEFRDGKWTKAPRQTANPKALASSTDPTTWSSFAEARQVYLANRRTVDGVGYVFAPDDPFGGVDLDNCLSATGEVLEWAEPWIEALGRAYLECSPSGRGLKGFLRGTIPGEGKGRKRTGYGPDQSGAIELYSRGRFFTVTGDAWHDESDMAADYSSALATLHAEIAAAKASKVAGPRPPAAALDVSDEALLEKAKGSRNGAKFSALFDRGDLSGHGGDDSSADMALMNQLAYWTAKDAARMERLFGQSALGLREKWTERPDYRQRTIDEAIAYVGDVYTPTARGKATRAAEPPPTIPIRPPAGDQGPPSPNEAEDDPHRLARIYRDTVCTRADGLMLRYHCGEYLRWDGAYREVAERDIRAELGATVKREFDRLNLAHLANHNGTGQKPIARKVTNALVGNVNLALAGYTRLAGPVIQPSWLDGDGPFPAHEVLPTRNALVHLPSFAAGLPATADPTPRFFAPYVLDYDFDGAAPEPVNWLTFLGARPIDGKSDVKLQLWPDDPQSIASLQEWFGLNLLPDTSHQKIGTFIGPKRSGKGTIIRVLTALIGAANVCNPTLSSLGTNFGLAPLIGKLSAIITDARLSGRADIAQIVENLLSISGEDSKTIDRKHMPAWTGRLSTRFTIVSNETPRLAENSGALAGRMIMFRLTRTFFGQEDHKLFGKLLPELPGILLWAIEGWKALRDRGHFVQPQSGEELVEEMQDLASPIGMFVKERCDLGPEHSVSVETLFSEWKAWCGRKNRERVGDEQAFGRNLRSVVSNLETKPVKRDGQYSREFRGVGIKAVF